MPTYSPSTFARTDDNAQRSDLTGRTARELREPRIDDVEADGSEPGGIDSDVELAQSVSAERAIVRVPVEKGSSRVDRAVQAAARAGMSTISARLDTGTRQTPTHTIARAQRTANWPMSSELAAPISTIVPPPEISAMVSSTASTASDAPSTHPADTSTVFRDRRVSGGGVSCARNVPVSAMKQSVNGAADRPRPHTGARA
jgi:hypothetical protein